MNRVLTDIKVGADSEAFVFSKKENKVVSSIGLIGGSKYSPKDTSQFGFCYSEDNVLAEFTIPPTESREEFINNILLGQNLFKEILPESDFELLIKASHKFEPEQLMSYGAQEMGCEPDQNAWLGGKTNPRPRSPKDGLRSAGTHVHIGYTLDSELAKALDWGDADRKDINRHLIKWMDLFLGVPFMKVDKDMERRRLYGKAGAYRDKPYGVEYRTLSSVWTKSKELIGWVYDQTQKAIDRVSMVETINDSMYERIANAINLGHTPTIDGLIEEYKLQTP